MSIRTERINSELQKAICEIVRDLRDPKVLGASKQGVLISIMGVDTAPDLKNAKVFVSIYGSKTEESIKEEIFVALKDCTNFVNAQLKHILKHMRSIPKIQFVKDNTMDYASKMDKLFDSIASGDLVE